MRKTRPIYLTAEDLFERDAFIDRKITEALEKQWFTCHSCWCDLGRSFAKWGNPEIWGDHAVLVCPDCENSQKNKTVEKGELTDVG